MVELSHQKSKFVKVRTLGPSRRSSRVKSGHHRPRYTNMNTPRCRSRRTTIACRSIRILVVFNDEYPGLDDEYLTLNPDYLLSRTTCSGQRSNIHHPQKIFTALRPHLAEPAYFSIEHATQALSQPAYERCLLDSANIMVLRKISYLNGFGCTPIFPKEKL